MELIINPNEPEKDEFSIGIMKEALIQTARKITAVASTMNPTGNLNDTAKVVYELAIQLNQVAIGLFAFSEALEDIEGDTDGISKSKDVEKS